MSTETRHLTVAGLNVEVVRKDIKNLHLGVYPPHGRVRVAAPLAVSDEAVRMAVIGKLGWIRRQRARFEAQSRQSRRNVVSGESHYYLGRRYRLNVVEHDAPTRLEMRGNSRMTLFLRTGTTPEQRERWLADWYRGQLKALIPPLLKKWQARLGVEASAWGVKKMKTKWGGCNPVARRLWFNLELAKKPGPCLEYIVVHELAHLLVPKHDEHFIALMDRHLPQWQAARHLLNAMPLAHEEWDH